MVVFLFIYFVFLCVLFYLRFTIPDLGFLPLLHPRHRVRWALVQKFLYPRLFRASLLGGSLMSLQVHVSGICQFPASAARCSCFLLLSSVGSCRLYMTTMVISSSIWTSHRRFPWGRLEFLASHQAVPAYCSQRGGHVAGSFLCCVPVCCSRSESLGSRWWHAAGFFLDCA
jgi:hypothetical protein